MKLSLDQALMPIDNSIVNWVHSKKDSLSQGNAANSSSTSWCACSEGASTPWFSCSPAVYFHTVGSIPRADEKSSLDDSLIVDKRLLTLSLVENWPWRAVFQKSLEYLNVEAHVHYALQHRFCLCWHCSWAINIYKTGFFISKLLGRFLTLYLMIYCWMQDHSMKELDGVNQNGIFQKFPNTYVITHNEPV